MPYSVNPTHRLMTHVAPVDKNAVRELRVHSPVRWTMTECPALSKVSPRVIGLRHHSSFRDLTGLRRGAMEIVGLFEWHEDGKSLWVARCDCGRFEFRRHYKWWNNFKKGSADRCQECARVEYPVTKDHP